MLDYILIGLTALAGFVAIRGETWDEAKPRFYQRLTHTGWIALILIMSTGLVSAWKQHIDNTKLAAVEIPAQPGAGAIPEGEHVLFLTQLARVP